MAMTDAPKPKAGFEQLEGDLALARVLCRQSLAHLEDCSDVWTPGNRLVRSLREFLGLPVAPLGPVATKLQTEEAQLMPDPEQTVILEYDDTKYSVLLEYDPEYGDYTASIPELSGIVTQGKTLDEAFAMAKEAAALYLEDEAEAAT